MPTIAETLASLRRAFERAQVRWYVFGAQAAIVHGLARLTADVDVTVLIGSNTTASLIELLANEGVVPRVPLDAEFLSATRVIPMLHRSGMPVDVVLGAPGLEEDFAARADEVFLGEVPVPVARLEDILIMKMMAARTKDLDDVAELLRVASRPIALAEVRTTLGVVEQAIGETGFVDRFDQLVRRASDRE